MMIELGTDRVLKGDCPQCGRETASFGGEVCSKGIFHPLIAAWCGDCMRIVAYAVPDPKELLLRGTGIGSTVTDCDKWKVSKEDTPGTVHTFTITTKLPPTVEPPSEDRNEDKALPDRDPV